MRLSIRPILFVALVAVGGLTLDFFSASKAQSANAVTQLATKIVVDKSMRKMRIFRGDAVLRTYSVNLGDHPSGRKTSLGDHRTEGDYFIDGKSDHGCCDLSLHISYPSPDDTKFARKAGKSPGGNVLIHGIPNGYGWMRGMYSSFFSTKGCIQLTNAEIEDLWPLVNVGTPIEILP